MSYLWCIDHDGTASYGDIGRDYLCGLMGMDSDEFVKHVDRIRSDPEYKKLICNGQDYDEGLELALMASHPDYRLKQDDVRKMGSEATNSLRKGFRKFLDDPERGRGVIFSAGLKDFLINFYMSNFPNRNFDVVGTSMHVDQNGYYVGIRKQILKIV